MDKTNCTSCSAADPREAALTGAARYPALKGSRFVGSRGVRDLYVCRECGAMWRTWHDQREGYQCWRKYPKSIVPVFSADTSLARLVAWVASHYTEDSFGLTDSLATRLIRRRPEGLRQGIAELFRCFGELIPPKDARAAERLTMHFRLLRLSVERAIRGDLRSEGSRVKPPTRYRDAEVEEAARSFRPRSVDGLARLPKTHDVIRRLMWESRWQKGCPASDDAVIAIHDMSPILSFLENLPLEVVDDGILRGVHAESAFKAAGILHDRGRLPENDHAIWMSQRDWIALERILDPLIRLATSVRRIREAAKLGSGKKSRRLQMETLLVRTPIRYGARFTETARRELERIAREFRLGREDDDVQAHEALSSILETEKKATKADARCVLAKA
ncbi:MAG: hypothetical protein GY906_21090 [bacterium]|nr:hypothetical protein [bacterium]